MRKMGSAIVIGLALGALPAAAQTAGQAGADKPQPTAPQDELDDMGDEDIVVTGQRERGSVVGDIKPEQQLRAADIRSYGVASVSELLTELAPQTDGTPIVLLNGKRISSFSEIQDIPSEAISRVDILPEEVALSYGYAATQKVVNIVLRRRFRAETADLRVGTTTDGGRENGRVNAGMLRIRGDNRFNLDVQYSAAADLLESQRDISPTSPSRPFSLAGNITAPGGIGEIDPMLSALAGRPVTIAPVPATAVGGRPPLAAFLAGANQAGVSDLGAFRTLSPETRNLAINGTLARALPGDVSLSINGRVELSESDGLQGLPGVTLDLPAGNPYSPFGQPVQLYRYLDGVGALGQRTRGVTGHFGVSLNGRIAKTWMWSFTGAYDVSQSRTATERGVDTGALQAAIRAGDPAINPFGPIAPGLLGDLRTDRARSTSNQLTGDLLLSGPLFSLPAGKATASIKVGGQMNDVESRTERLDILRSAQFSRNIGSGQFSVDLPIASRNRHVLGAIGDLGVNANVAIEQLSDFGTLTTYGYGLRWTPIPAIRIIASQAHSQSAPTGQQINAPQIVTPNVPVFDYRSGQTVFVSQIGGGNPLLTESEQHRTRIGVTIKPFDKPDLTVTATWLDVRTDNPTAAFPTPTPQIEAAFPDRFLRDAEGALVQVDSRPINFAEQHSSQLRWGFNLSIPLKSSIQRKIEAWRAAGAKPEDRPPELAALFGNRRRRDEGGQGGDRPATSGGQAERERGGGGERAQGGGGGRRFGGRGGGRGGGGGRLQFAAYHTWHLTERILIDRSLPALDLLNGAAVGSSGGQPRHEVEIQAGYTNNGLGARISGNWQSATRVDGALGVQGSTLRFDDLATVDLRLFANLGQMPKLVRAHPFFRGSRVTISIVNLFNSRQSVTDATGNTPLRYQPAYLDPLGRTISIGFRKLF